MTCRFGPSLSCALLFIGYVLVLGLCLKAHGQQQQYKRAETDEELSLLLRDNLDPDMAPHREAIKTKPFKFSGVVDTGVALQAIKFWKHMSLVVMKGGVMHIAPYYATPPPPTPKRMAAMQAAVANATAAGISFPDCVFIMNTWDQPRCPVRRRGLCSAPVFSVIKQWDERSQSSPDLDVLVPFFNHMYEDTVDFPWKQKKGKALMRAAVQNGMPPNCTRVWLYRQGQTPEGSQYLDTGITNNLKVGLTGIELSPYITLQDHAKYKYLVSADGFTASCRFGKLLGVDSLVLKESSRWVEYYYRSVHPQEHFMPFSRNTLVQVVKSLESGDQKELQGMAAAARRFQQTYLSQHSKAAYLSAALRAYVGLWPDGAMSKLVASLDTSKLTDIQYLQQALREADTSLHH